jgi:hypothetical protein
VSSILTFLAIQIYYSKDAGSLEGNQGIFIMILAGIFWTLVLTLCSLTVFFNINDKVRHNRLYSILTFFFAPFLLSTIVFIKSDFQDMWQSFFIMTISFFLTHFYFYYKFINTDFDPIIDYTKTV